MPLALSQVRVDSLLGASCPGCEVRVDQGESPGCELTCYQTGLHVGSACCFGSSIGLRITRDADMARQPSEVNVKV